MKRGVPEESTKFARGINWISFPTAGLVTDRALRIAENQAVEVEPLSLAESFIREEKERLVPDQRAAKIPAELVALEWRRLGRSEVEEVAGVEDVVAQKLEQLAVKFSCRSASPR